uniref:PLAT domain-containing protein n=1 Tax=Macrostomum lignano TaxID=282301 RepID=A0A1I8F3A9_9PLAT
LFLSSGQSTRRLEPFSAESSLPGCQVRCQLKPVSGRLRCIFSLDRRGVGDFVEVSSEPVEPPAGGFFACVGMHSPGEIVQLVDSAAWRPAAAETSAAVAGAVGSEDSGQEREPFDSVRYQLASVWPQLELPCHVQSVGLRGGNRGISGVLSGLLMIELRTSEPTQIRVISSGSVRCHLVTRAASGDSASAQSESESSWQSLLEMLGSIEEKRAPQFQGKGGGGKAAALTFKKKGGGGKGEQKEQEDEANSDADEDDKAERELVVNASRKDGQRFVCIRVLAPLHGAAAARAAASGQVSEMAEADKSLKGHDTVEVVVSGYGESQQRHKVQLRLLTPSELAAAGSQHQRRLFAVPFTEENARQAGGPCDLLEVLDSAGAAEQAAGAEARLVARIQQEGDGGAAHRALYRVTEVDDKEVSIKSLSVLNASATKVKLDSANLESPQLADLVSMSAASLANPEVLLPRFPSPNALGNWNRKSRHKFISNESFLYGHSCQFFRHRTVAGLGLSTVSSLLSGATRSNVGGGLLWVFLPQPGRLHRLGLAELGRPEQLRAHLMCCSGAPHRLRRHRALNDISAGVPPERAQPAIRQLLRNRLAIPSHKLLAPGGDADEAAASALSQELLQSRLWIEAAVRQHLLSGYSAAHWHSVSSVGHAAAAAAPAAGDATAAAADAASSSEPEVDSQQRQLVQQLMAAYVTPPPATQPDKLYAAGRLAPAACRAHLLCLTEGLLDEALEADPAGGVSAALRPYAECVRSARLMASTRLTDTASLTELTCLETLALIRLPGLRSLGPAGQLPTGRLRSLQVTKCDLESADAAAACPNLKSLSFSATKLATLPDSWKPDSPLETLTIDCCPMAALPASLGRLRHLRTLRLSQLPLRTLPPELASLQTLEELAVDGVAWPDSLMDNLTSGSHVSQVFPAEFP